MTIWLSAHCRHSRRLRASRFQQRQRLKRSKKKTKNHQSRLHLGPCDVLLDTAFGESGRRSRPGLFFHAPGPSFMHFPVFSHTIMILIFFIVVNSMALGLVFTSGWISHRMQPRPAGGRVYASTRTGACMHLRSPRSVWPDFSCHFGSRRGVMGSSTLKHISENIMDNTPHQTSGGRYWQGRQRRVVCALWE